jgi:hypothetical protein
MHSQPSERAAVIGRVNPQTVANSEKFTDVIDVSKFAEVMAVALLGDMANETVTFTAYACDSAGNNASAISGKAKTYSASATANDNVQCAINVKSEQVAPASGQTNRYVKFGLVTGGATGGPAAVVVLGLRPHFGPASDDKLSSCTVVT